MSLFHELFEAGEVISFGSFLAGSPPHVAFCCKLEILEDLRTALAAYGDFAGRLAPLENFENYLALNLAIEQVIVVAPDGEDEACASVRRSLENKGFPEPILQTLKIVGLFADIFPFFLIASPAGEQWNGRNLEAPLPTNAGKRCFVFGSPRSGTTYLCSLMHSAGCGNPAEHIRPYVLKIARRQNSIRFNYFRFLRRLVEAGAVGGIASTKIIYHTLLELIDLLTAEQMFFATELLFSGTVIAMSREDRLAQAVSWAKGQLTGRWHSYEPGPSSPSEIPLDMIRGQLGRLVDEDRSMARLLASVPNTIVVDYDELTRNPQPVLSTICRSLGVPSPSELSAHVEKLADDWNKSAVEKFLAAFPNDELLGVASVAELLAEERRKLEENARTTRERADRIRSGHAQTRSGPYQDRHYWLLDYEAFTVGGFPHMVRGPRPASLNPGEYGVCIGAAQTYGAFVPGPYPKLLGQRLDTGVLNLSGGGVGPRFFSESAPMLSLIADARFVVVQAMSARMMPTAMFAPINEMNLMRMREGGRENLDAADVWRIAVDRCDAGELRVLIEQAHEAWVEAMQKIASVCTGPKVLFWFSERPIHYDLKLDSVDGIFGMFPQLVDEDCMRLAAKNFDEVVVLTTSRGMPQSIVSQFSGEVLPVIFGGADPATQYTSTVNSYYPSPEMHHDAAVLLEDSVKRLLHERVYARN